MAKETIQELAKRLNLDKSKCYCQTCLLEGKIIPLDYNEQNKDDKFIEIKCNHLGRNKNTLRYHNGEWHLFYGFLKNAQCRTCQAKKNLESMNDPNGESRKKLQEWYKTDKCKTMLKQNADNWRASEKGKTHAIANCETYRASDKFKEHGADSLKAYIKTDEFKVHITKHNKENNDKLNTYYEEYCGTCGKITIHNGFETCGLCNPNILKTIPNFEIKNNIRYYKDKDLTQLCNDLLSSKEDIENYPGFEIHLGRVTYDRKDILTDESILFDANFQIRNDVKYYKNEPVSDIISKLNSGKYDMANFPRWNKRFGEWCYGTENILTGEINKLNGSNFYEKNKELWYYDKSISDYVPWEEFKSGFVAKNIDFLNSIQVDYPSAKIIPTFRSQDSDTWAGAKGAFEQSLIEQNISWVTYIKFYIDENEVIKPLVVGVKPELLLLNMTTDRTNAVTQMFASANGIQMIQIVTRGLLVNFYMKTISIGTRLEF